MALTQVKDGNIVSLDSSQLVGKLPEMDGTALTGMASPSVVKQSSDPLYTSNGYAVGTLWANYSNGTLWVCTQSSSNDMYWRNCGTRSGGVNNGSGVWGMQGNLSGFTSGGGSPNIHTIDKFNFSSNSTASDHGDLSVARGHSAGTQY